MWWKLIGTILVTATAIVGIIPVKTHAVKLSGDALDRPSSITIADLIRAKYDAITPATGGMILIIVAISAYAVVHIVRHR